MPTADDTPLEKAGLELILELLPDVRQPTAPLLYHAGLAHVLDEPDLAAGEDLARLLDILENGHGLDRFFALLVGSQVEVLIGGEPPLEQVPRFSFVLAPFGAPEPAGVLGVVGPRRLPYERAVPAVRYVSSLLTRLYAGEEV